MRCRPFPVALCLALFIALVACDGAPRDPGAPPGATAGPAPRLVVLYLTCTLNRDYIGPYDPAVDSTPHLTRFAEGAVVFENHQTESGLSGAAFASILSGAQADDHAVFRHPRQLDDGLQLVFETFGDAGFDVFYWADIQLASDAYNYAQGVPREHIHRRPLQAGDPQLRAILDRLERDPSYRALVVSAFTITHAPYGNEDLESFRAEFPAWSERVEMHPLDTLLRHYYRTHLVTLWTSYDEQLELAPLPPGGEDYLIGRVDLQYRSKIHRLDQLFGGVLDEIERSTVADESLIALTADHGDTTFRDPQAYRWTHGPDLQPEVINVPFLLRDGTGRVAPRRVSAATRSIDLHPTLAGLAGVEVPTSAPVRGIDLSAALLGEAPFPAEPAYSHGTLRTLPFVEPDVIERIRVSRKDANVLYRWRPEHARRPGSEVEDVWRFEVFDLAADRNRDLYDPGDAVHRAAADDLWAYRNRLIERYREQNPAAPGTREDRIEALPDADYEALRALGYIDPGEDAR